MGLVVFLAPLAFAYGAFVCLTHPLTFAKSIVETLKEQFDDLFKDKTDISSFN